ncbi:MAG: prolipoprotein diacylglyceryl transferase [Chlorobium sp.]|jgi:phosphatidylglycerol:prolipoprotein diacylglycerol transferase|uniref:prolipoprotein diacylglyceryl transferase n=1 Tax=Chlorobium sp. TaxID=1095 RepID=UPI001DC100B9|nr:prolipoprotein diacylglyceryl transferase [Chlorobium sp.]MBN1278932.1 prolipoprotein diacylglyceryl transferase [Chlorobiaceae bacterium]MCF8216791.1 prolipoprotein diacylglyceryl transferase [Chlorobium sp.]MCF8271542.1 prolipoprotein diacylglyceryl transferase [Chlorobium sp.]MCF8287914.1 prolipoprotein diacylglyceryl transferase [Chlorobium sp.]MCF8291592.1 prolipoprotein diacylglyceryl transferase [Chlorobium sp.]
MSDFLFWWQNLPAQMNPVIFSLGGFPVRWYGTMYIVAFTVVYLLTLYRLKTEKTDFSKPFIGDALTWAMVGVVIGGRLGYIVFYGLDGFFADPLGTILPRASSSGGCSFAGITGMSYHGGVIGVVLAMWFFSRSQNKGFYETFDLFIPSLPLGYTFGRLGNFINGELYGRVTDAAVGMYFPMAPTIELRHPSQLYEAFFEGIVLFLVLWALRKRSPYPGFLSGLYLFGYGFVRFFIEYFREPDAHLGFVLLNLSMGQLLCLAMMLAGAAVVMLQKTPSTRR